MRFPTPLLWFLAFSALALLLSLVTPYLPGTNDSYYHLAMGRLMMERGILYEFPWLWMTTLREQFVNQHMGFHLLLGSFDGIVTSLLSMLGVAGLLTPYFGAKLWSAMVTGGVATILLLAGRGTKTKALVGPWIVLLLLLPYDFWFRMMQVRGQGLALLLLLASLFFFERKRWILLLLVSVFFPWIYGGFVFVPVVFAIIEGITWAKSRSRLTWSTWRGTLTVSVSILGGLLLHPYSPNIFPYLWTQIVGSGLGMTLLEPQEWMPYAPLVFVAEHLVLLPIFFYGLWHVWKHRTSLSPRPFALLGVALFFLAFTLKSQRFIEYWPAFAVLFLAALHQEKPLLPPGIWSPRLCLSLVALVILGASWIPGVLEPFPFGTEILSLRLALSILLVPFLLIACVWPIPKHAKRTSAVMALGFLLGLYNMALVARSLEPPVALVLDTQELGRCLAEKTPPQTVVFIDTWDRFPLLFSVNHHNYYTLGLDPIFMYARSPALWQKYRVLPTSSESGTLLREALRTDFDAEVAVVGVQHTAFAEKLLSTPGASILCNTRNVVAIDLRSQAPAEKAQVQQ